jgi:hypothetical protein
MPITEEKQTVIGQINKEQKKQLQELLHKYEDVIAKDGQTNIIQHQIYTKDVPPISQR